MGISKKFDFSQYYLIFWKKRNKQLEFNIDNYIDIRWKVNWKLMGIKLFIYTDKYNNWMILNIKIYI